MRKVKKVKNKNISGFEREKDSARERARDSARKREREKVCVCVYDHSFNHSNVR